MASDQHFDFAVIGSGFGGSIMSMVLRRLGYSVLLLERGTHPRFAIGESSTPFANLLLEVLAEEYDLPVLKELSEWGSWQRSHPQVAAGLKRGFTFYRGVEHLLVAASPNDDVADTHWYRPDVDLFLVKQAQSLGVTYRDRFEITGLRRMGAWWLISDSWSTSFIIDASGSNSVLARHLGMPDISFATMPRTRALYAHFRNVNRLKEMIAGAPYPPEDAAVHHVFDHGWMWVLRFNNGITSAGFAYTGPEQTWEQLVSKVPAGQEIFATAQRITPLYRADQLSFRRSAAAGENFALLPSAAAFVDPLLSTGFALTLLGIKRLGELFARKADLGSYEAQTFREADAVADLVSALYAKMPSFPEFSRLTMLYFAAMSYTETAWRIGKQDLAADFLLTGNASFRSFRETLCAAARRGETITRDAVVRAIEPFDVAGLTRRDGKGCFPVDFADVIEARHKLAASMQDLEPLLRKLQISGKTPQACLPDR